MSKPQRHQRKRVRGWRKPPGSVIVDRTSRWGNPHKVGRDVATAEEAVLRYREHLHEHPELVAAMRRELAGKDVCCPCPEDAVWCHGDDVIRVANGGPVEPLAWVACRRITVRLGPGLPGTSLTSATGVGLTSQR